jgi:hypothetical protein
MKKALAMAAAVMALVSQIALADPPSAVGISIVKDRIMVTAMHATKDASRHFIGEIEVSVNGVKLIDQKFLRQANDKMQLAQFNCPGLKAGDKVSATATCNIMGSKTTEIVVQQADAEHPLDKPFGMKKQ